VVETIRLESGHTLTGIVGSNPTLSAILFTVLSLGECDEGGPHYFWSGAGTLQTTQTKWQCGEVVISFRVPSSVIAMKRRKSSFENWRR
jgi:hypothetical protein